MPLWTTHFVFFERYITNAWGLGNLQTAENEANLLFLLGTQKLKGSAPGPHWGLRPRPPL